MDMHVASRPGLGLLCPGLLLQRVEFNEVAAEYCGQLRTLPKSLTVEEVKFFDPEKNGPGPAVMVALRVNARSAFYNEGTSMMLTPTQVHRYYKPASSLEL